MRKLGLLFLVLSVLAFGSVPSAKPGSYTPVPLIVTVNGCNPLTVSEICGDNGENDAVYIDGDQGVRANLDQYGSLIIDFQTTRAKIRGLVYKYDDASMPISGSNHYVSTIGGAFQAMGVGEANSIEVASCPLYDDDAATGQYRHSFNRDCQSGLGAIGEPLRATRTSLTTWVLEPSGDARVFSITTKGRTQVTDFGPFSLPFTMTLQAK